WPGRFAVVMLERHPTSNRSVAMTIDDHEALIDLPEIPVPRRRRTLDIALPALRDALPALHELLAVVRRVVKAHRLELAARHDRQRHHPFRSSLDHAITEVIVVRAAERHQRRDDEVALPRGADDFAHQ